MIDSNEWLLSDRFSVINLKRKRGYDKVNTELAPRSVFHRFSGKTDGNSHSVPLTSWAANDDSIVSPVPKFLIGTPLGTSPELEIDSSYDREAQKAAALEATLASLDQPISFRGAPVRPIKKRNKRPLTLLDRVHRYWIYEEISFSMNKLSLFGLVFGLMILGALFFTMGFLVAVATLNHRTTQQAQQQGTWSTANVAPQQPGIMAQPGSPPPQPAVASPPQPAAPHAAPGGKAPGGIVGSILQRETLKIESKLGGGAVSGALSHVPAPLQPFAVHAQNRATARVQGNVAGAAGAVSSGQYPGTPVPNQPQGPQAGPQYPQPLEPQPYGGTVGPQQSYAPPPPPQQPQYAPPPPAGAYGAPSPLYPQG